MAYTYKGSQAIVPAKHKHGTFNPALCGTMAGYQAHDRYGIPKCLPCRLRKSLENAAQYAVRRAA